MWQSRQLTLKFESLEEENIEWIIPSFPVLTIEFRKGTAKNRRTTLPVLIRTEDSRRVKTGDEIVCSKSCYIKIENSNYLVLWEFGLSETVMLNATAEDRDCLIEEESHCSDIEHTVPFKVLGVAYKGRQISLKKAYESLEEDKPVQAKLQPEPDNDYDQQAIAVYINYQSGWEKVGYIATELTSELHPLLERNNLKITVAHIRFRVNYLQVGFYLTLKITKQGPWSKKVVKAFKRVN